MSHYNVNASVPKTLIRHLIRWAIEAGEFDASTCTALQAILATTISPELIPSSVPGAGYDPRFARAPAVPRGAGVPRFSLALRG